MLLERETLTNRALAAATETRPFLVVVAGEFKSGKSSLINAMLRRRLLPTTSEYYQRPAILVRQSETETGGLVYDRDGLRAPIQSLEPGVDLSTVTLCEMYSHAPHLDGIDLVELPFYSDGVVTDDTIGMMASADLLIWVTIGSQSWRLSEKSTLMRLPPEMKDRTILAVSRTDKFRSASDRQRIADRLNREAKGFVTDIVFVESSPDLIQKSGEDEAAWARTGGAALCTLIHAARDRHRAEERQRALAASGRSADVIAFPSASPDDDVAADVRSGEDETAEPVETGDRPDAAIPADVLETPVDIPAPSVEPEAVASPGELQAAPEPVAVAEPDGAERRLSDMQQERVQALRDIAATINGIQCAGIVRAVDDGTRALVLNDAMGNAASAGPQARACLAALASYDRFTDSATIEDAIIACGRVTLLIVPSHARGDVLYLLVRHEKTNAAIARTIMRRMDTLWAA